ncbi:MAG: hypothetical protein J3K34DRAFT_427940 [Monoraphidium minutum]|nr:MAG: hypothetical protein J3K34DRAFT_427940 [Monoraphidium minutum]
MRRCTSLALPLAAASSGIATCTQGVCVHVRRPCPPSLCRLCTSAVHPRSWQPPCGGLLAGRAPAREACAASPGACTPAAHA